MLVNIMDDAILRKVGLNVTKKTTVMNLSLNVQREQQGDLSGNKVQFSMSKKLQRLAKIKRLKDPIVKIKEVEVEKIVEKPKSFISNFAITVFTLSVNTDMSLLIFSILMVCNFSISALF